MSDPMALCFHDLIAMRAPAPAGDGPGVPPCGATDVGSEFWRDRLGSGHRRRIERGISWLTLSA
jgi:hypothetical protein